MSDTDQLVSITEQQVEGAVIGYGAGVAMRGLASLEARELAAAGAEACPAGVCSATGRCFAAGTTVATPDGDRPIETLRAGDMVLSRDEHTGETSARPVLSVLITPDRQVLELELRGAAGEDRLKATSTHPFFIAGQGWVEAGKLLPGMHLSTPSGTAEVISVRPVSGRTTVYNLEVASTHTYFVGQLRSLVHNQCSVVVGTPNFKGIVGEERSIAQIEAEGGTVTGQHVMFVGPTGQRTTIDLVWVDAEGYLRGTEGKFGEYARLTKPQSVVYPNGGHLALVPVGENAIKAGLAPGVLVGIHVDIARWLW
jgi:hypothetical protein